MSSEDYSKPLMRYEKQLAKNALIKILKKKEQIKRSTIREYYPMGDYRLLKRLTVQGFLTLTQDHVKSYYQLTPKGITEFNLANFISDI